MGPRPFVWQLARGQVRCGDVCNDDGGVLVRLAEGDDGFIVALVDHYPPPVHINSTDCIPYCWAATSQDFTIRENGTGYMYIQTVPDAATYPTCLAEMSDPRARRYCYPFINYAHRGPRLVIIRAIPYDRSFTAMVSLPLCFPCETEFRGPVDHRFHAQPVVCLDYGLQLEWRIEGEALSSEVAL